MLDVMIDDQYRAMPGIGFMVLKVEVEPTYETSQAKANMENAVTLAAEATCGKSQRWKEIAAADAYIQFYRSMGLNPNRVSNPLKQAFRFTKKRYQSISPIIDLAMYAEYGTGVSFQVMSSSAIADMLRIEPVSAKDTGHLAVQPKLGEVGMFSGDQLVHSPSTGLLPQAMWKAAEATAIVRLMSPPGLGCKRLKEARQRFVCSPAGLKVCTLDEWSYSND